MNQLTNIHHQIIQQGDIPFVEFMQRALYDPLDGYYSTDLQKFGAAGDFITAPELTPLFGQTLANQCQQLLPNLDNPILFEFGAGSGRLCVDLLKQLEQNQCLPNAYHILEVSHHLQQRQFAYFQQSIPQLLPRIQWLKQWPGKPFNGIVIANEVLDAMPVHRFLKTAEGLFESYVALDAQQQLVETFKPCTNPALIDYLAKALPEVELPYQSEANLLIDSWIQGCYDMLQQGLVLLIDYGFPRHEYYHPERSMGTLMCHYQHRVHSNPLIHVGQQDITAHVDFTHVALAAEQAGFQLAGFSNQTSFLLANGLLNLLDEWRDERDCLKAQQAAKLLLQPDEMGELFKVLALTKGIEVHLNGFQLQDKRASL